MAHALLELFSVTRNVACGRAALRLFRNEATIINEGTRLLSRRKSACSRQFHELSYVANEISGSQSVPGIALARIRAYEVLREGKLKSYAAPGIVCRKTLENPRALAVAMSPGHAGLWGVRKCSFARTKFLAQPIRLSGPWRFRWHVNSRTILCYPRRRDRIIESLMRRI